MHKAVAADACAASGHAQAYFMQCDLMLEQHWTQVSRCQQQATKPQCLAAGRLRRWLRSTAYTCAQGPSATLGPVQLPWA